jgi:hypothetical protein
VKIECYLLIFLLLYILLNVNQYNIFALSPSFIRQEIHDGNDDWYFHDIYHGGKNKTAYSESTIAKITGKSIGNIDSVTYISDGKNLNITFWLTSLFPKTLPQNHSVAFLVYIDIDADLQTGWNGIDYINRIDYNEKDKTWRSSFYEKKSETDTGAKYLSVSNYTDFSRGVQYASMTLDLESMNYPQQYRIVFLMEDFIQEKKRITKIIDFVNTVYIPPMNFMISTSSEPITIVRGEEQHIELQLKSVNPIISINGLQPKALLYPDNKVNKMNLYFNPNPVNFSVNGIGISDLTVKAPKDLSARLYTVPIISNISFPSEFLGNPSETKIIYSNMSVLVANPLPFEKQVEYFFSNWVTNISTIILTLISIATGLIGLGLGKKLKKSKNKRIDEY